VAALALGIVSTTLWGQAPTLTFPTSVDINILSQNTDPTVSQSYLTINLANITGTYSVTNGNYLGWCVDDPDTLIFEAQLPKPLLSSYDPSASTIYPGVPWPKINYILNHKQGTFQDIQEAIWKTIFPSNPGHFPVTTAVTNMINGAAANPNFIPAQGGVVAVIIQFDGPVGNLQDVAIEVQIPITTNQTPPPTIACGTVNTVTGQQGSPYSAQLTVTGGTSPFTFTLASGVLPANLTLGSTTGKISGTPIVAGSFPITVKVTDSAQLSATSTTCTINITASNSCGLFTTYTQGGWGAAPHGNNPGAILKQYFSLVFPTGSVSIGSGSKVLTFNSALAIQNFLPAGGTPGTLSASATNPTSSSAGVFAGQLLAATLSLDFSNAGITRFGLASQKVKSGVLAGYTVTQVLALANQVIAGNYVGMPAGLTVSGLSDVLNSINNNYDNGTQNQGYLQ
jgi:hypothetical protein